MPVRMAEIPASASDISSAAGLAADRPSACHIFQIGNQAGLWQQSGIRHGDHSCRSYNHHPWRNLSKVDPLHPRRDR